jgi:hypothetical protein
MWKTMRRAKKEEKSKKERKQRSLLEKWKTPLNPTETGQTQRPFPLSHRLDYDYNTLTMTGHFICYKNRTT